MFPRLSRALSFLLLSLALLPGQAAGSGLMSTDKAIAAASERERVQALVARPDVARRLEALGVLPAEARTRIDALTDAEVSALGARIDALPAGGMSDRDWLKVILVILLVIIIL
jgi:hypothetical protein